MSKTKTVENGMPGVSSVDLEVADFREQFAGRALLDQLVRRGARQILQQAIEAEVQEFLDQHQERRDDQGNRLVVRNGHKPSRTIVTGAGPLEVTQPRVRDNTPRKDERVQFHSAILPPYLRRSKAIEEFIPWRYLKGCTFRNLPCSCHQLKQAVEQTPRFRRQLLTVGSCPNFNADTAAA
jgi:hypothetical protein